MTKKRTSPEKMVVVGSFVAFVFVAVALFFYVRGGFGSDITIEKSNMVLAKRMKSGEVTSADGQNSMKYRLFVPDNLEDKKYPLVVWLHGAGGRGSDNLSHLDDGVGAFMSYEVQRHQPSFVLAPQCPESRQWVDMADSGPPYVNYELDSVPESVWFKLLIQLIEELEEKYPIDTARRYVSGFSMGAAGVWDIITRHPDFFAAAMPVTGKGDPSKADRLVSIPIWAFHGKFDPIAPVENTRSLVRAIEKAGGKQVKETELWRKHYILQHVFKDFEPFRWLFQQRKGGSHQ